MTAPCLISRHAVCAAELHLLLHFCLLVAAAAAGTLSCIYDAKCYIIARCDGGCDASDLFRRCCRHALVYIHMKSLHTAQCCNDPALISSLADSASHHAEL